MPKNWRKQSEKKNYWQMDKSESQKCKPKYQSESQEDKMDQSKSQKCTIEYKIYFEIK